MATGCPALGQPQSIHLEKPAAASPSVRQGDGFPRAASLGVGLATVRTLLRRAFDKTDTHRQAELVRLMLAHRLPAAPNGPATES